MSHKRAVAQLGSALDWGSRGRRFKSRQPDHFLFVLGFMKDSQNKNELRKAFLKRRNDLSLNERVQQDKAINENLFSFLSNKDISALLIYVSFRTEVDTIEIIKKALSLNIKVATPRCKAGSKEMDFFEIKSLGDLESGAYGILEPSSRLTEPLFGNENSFCIVPGAAFDKGGMRIGYGAGYYDRYLQKFKGKTVGLAYECQLSDDLLPCDEYDVPLDYLITDQKCYKF